MSRFSTKHWLAIGLTIGLIVLLFFAPRHLSNTVAPPAEVSQNEPPTVENEIDSALALVNEQPMQGILYLKSIADQNPGNFRAQYHLGKFSAQTGQWEKVIERFEKVKKIDPTFAESDYWLGVANVNLNRVEEGKVHLEKYLSSEENNDQLKNEAEIMLNQIN